MIQNNINVIEAKKTKYELQR